LAPEAKTQAFVSSGKTPKKKSSVVVAGDGERLIFYTAVGTLLKQATTTGNSGALDHTATAKALLVLCQLLPFVGGTRDVCKFMEMFVTHIFTHEEVVNFASLKTTTSDSLMIAKVVDLVEKKLEAPTDSDPYSGLSWLLTFAAKLLDEDLDLVQSPDENRGSIHSTLHIFLPHNKRGRNCKDSTRKIVNSAAEILIWRRSDAALANGVFSKALSKFRDPKLLAAGENEPIKTSLMSLQKVVRKFRLQLNGHAREKGYMLTDLFVMEPSRLNVNQIKSGKMGDLSKLTKFATKKKSTRTLLMISSRFASNPNSVAKYASIQELWRCFKSTSPDPGNDDFQLRRDIEILRLSATIRHLREVFAMFGDQERKLIVASVDGSTGERSNLNHIGAVLVVAAISSWPLELDGTEPTNGICNKVKLLIGQTEQSLDSFRGTISLIVNLISGTMKIDFNAETFIGGEGTDERVATSKAVLNLIDRHVVGTEGNAAPKANLLLFTSAVMRFPEDIQKAFTTAGFVIHCHDCDDMGERLRREKARKGDITISLAWDTRDDLDLHVFSPSNEEIYFANRLSRNGNACLDVDMNVCGDSEQPVENVFLGDSDRKIEADRGSYKVFVTNFNYHTKDRTAKIKWRVLIEKNGLKENFTGECHGVGKASIQAVCEFEYRGRTVPFPGEEKNTFDAANLVNLTTSSGQTLESVSQLLCVMRELKVLNETRILANENGGVQDEQSENRPMEVEAGTLEVTSRDRLDILLGRLPKRFHLAVSDVFGGMSLVEECAEKLAVKLVTEQIPLKALSDTGYPEDIIESVKTKLASGAAAATINEEERGSGRGCKRESLSK
jgi:hypothetical protein